LRATLLSEPQEKRRPAPQQGVPKIPLDLEEAAVANPFVHVELNTTDVGKAKSFYEQLFSWKLEDVPMPGGTYTMIDPSGGTGGGMFKNPMPGVGSAWLAYVDVDDVRASTAKVKALGGTVIKDVTQVPEMGEFSIICDPTGAVLGLWTSKNSN
jgi:predicted enzyme related to lactoylglutathione lyase